MNCNSNFEDELKRLCNDTINLLAKAKTKKIINELEFNELTLKKFYLLKGFDQFLDL